MPRNHNRKGRSRGGPNFTAVFHYMQDSPAWRALSVGARSAWLEVARLYNGANNGRLALSAADLAERLGVSKPTAWRALKELLAAGFIEVARQGYWKPVAELRVATEYRLTCYRCDVTGELPSKAFLKKSAVSKTNGSGFTHETKRQHDTADGFTHETKTAQNGQSPGFTHETHIDIYHGVAELSSSSSPDGAAVGWPECGYTMSGRELEALCEASGHSLKDFALRIGLPGPKVRSLRASKQVELGDDPFAVAAVDQMRGEAGR